MKKDVSIILPSIRPKNLYKFYKAAEKACKERTFEIVIASPYNLPEELEEFDNITSILEEIKGLLLKHPHLVVSRQKVVDRNER